MEDSQDNSTARRDRKVELCPTYWTERGCGEDSECPKLHICRYHLQTFCEKGESNCKFSHSLHDDHNSRIMENNGLEDINVADMRRAYKTSQFTKNRQLPEACKFYNGMRNGCKHSSDEYSKCHCLHICKFFILDKCKYQNRCKCSHSLKDPQPANVLRHYGINIFDENEEEIIL